MRVLAAYGLDDTPKMDRERTFVKSIFLLQIVHPDDLDAPEDTIIHDLEITDVRPPPSCSVTSSPLHAFRSIQTFLLHPIFSTFLEPRFL